MCFTSLSKSDKSADRRLGSFSVCFSFCFFLFSSRLSLSAFPAGLPHFLPARDLTCFRSDCLGDKTVVGSANIARTTTCLHCPLQEKRGQLHLCLISGLHFVSIASHNTKSSARRTYSFMLKSSHEGVLKSSHEGVLKSSHEGVLHAEKFA
jgi:hypothetical protein